MFSDMTVYFCAVQLGAIQTHLKKRLQNVIVQSFPKQLFTGCILLKLLSDQTFDTGRVKRISHTFIKCEKKWTIELLRMLKKKMILSRPILLAFHRPNSSEFLFCVLFSQQKDWIESNPIWQATLLRHPVFQRNGLQECDFHFNHIGWIRQNPSHLMSTTAHAVRRGDWWKLASIFAQRASIYFVIVFFSWLITVSFIVTSNGQSLPFCLRSAVKHSEMKLHLVTKTSTMFSAF